MAEHLKAEGNALFARHKYGAAVEVNATIPAHASRAEQAPL
jgi:hypothetical protein